MDIISVSKGILDTFYTLANAPLALRAFALRAKVGSEVRKIERLRDAYKGRRCYVLGSGPSLKNIDFDMLADKHVITVNTLYRHPDYDKLSPLFHCALDPNMYRDNDCGREFLAGIERRPGTNFLLSTNAPKAYRGFDNCYVVAFGYLPSSRVHPFNLAKPSAAFVNVVHFAIELAIYLGFSEIVLLGCDFNQFTVRREYHVYEVEGGAERIARTWQDLLGHAIAIMQHESLYSYAQKKGVRVVNATRGSFLDVYPRGEVEDWL